MSEIYEASPRRLAACPAPPAPAPSPARIYVHQQIILVYRRSVYVYQQNRCTKVVYIYQRGIYEGDIAPSPSPTPSIHVYERNRYTKMVYIYERGIYEGAAPRWLFLSSAPPAPSPSLAIRGARHSSFVAYRFYIVYHRVFQVQQNLHFDPSLDASSLWFDVMSLRVRGAHHLRGMT